MIEKHLVIDTNVWLQTDNHSKLQKISEDGCRIFIPQAVFEEVKRISSRAKGTSIDPDCFKLLLRGLVEGIFTPISTNRTGIVDELKIQLEKEGIELKALLREEDVCEEPDINDLRILAAAIYLKRKAEKEGKESSVYLLTHDRWLAQFAVRCGIAVMGVKVHNGWAKKQRIPWRRLLLEF